MDTYLSVEHGRSLAPTATNERVLDYAPGSAERQSIKLKLDELMAARIELPLIIDGQPAYTGTFEDAVAPHNHQHVLASAHLAGRVQIEEAVSAALNARHDWSRLPWQERAAVFLRAADFVAGPWRSTLNAATMLGQSKTVHQAEIDSAAELVDFWRFNVEFMLRLYGDQPISSSGVWNRVDYRPLEGFVYAASPFNFTAIAGNLPCAPALMGNTVVWKPSATAKYSAHYIMQVLQLAGLPPGVINLVYGDPIEITDVLLASPHLAGIHFTGSTSVFNGLLKAVAANLGSYRNYPRVVGETGGKNFVVAHASSDVEALATAILRGGYEYQGQKCSAASRVFVPDTLWPRLKTRLCDEIGSMRVGDVANFSNFLGAVIDERAWDRHTSAIAKSREQNASVVAGGSSDKSKGYFVRPTLLEVYDVQSPLMTEELFGPIVSVFVYPERRYDEMLDLIDSSSAYGLTGSVFATDRRIITTALSKLRDAAGNIYINDKPTGAVVGQQPFGGSRASGTNDKAGSMWNLARWVSMRTIKETFVPPRDYRYAFLG